jgi:CheY-like chemotaxis protein
MPQADGYSLLRQLRALAPDSGGTIPAIALTAYARDIDRIDAQRAGYQRHLTKPVSPRALISAVAELVGYHAPAECSTDDGTECSFGSA